MVGQLLQHGILDTMRPVNTGPMGADDRVDTMTPATIGQMREVTSDGDGIVETMTPVATGLMCAERSDGKGIKDIFPANWTHVPSWIER